MKSRTLVEEGSRMAEKGRLYNLPKKIKSEEDRCLRKERSFSAKCAPQREEKGAL